jgi:hypothetical protein
LDIKASDAFEEFDFVLWLVRLQKVASDHLALPEGHHLRTTLLHHLL